MYSLKGFLDAGLDTLWKEIDSFEPLIGCLPGDTFTIQTLNESGAVLYVSLAGHISPGTPASFIWVETSKGAFTR